MLVVDDTPSIRLLIRTNLELAGYEVSEAFDGQDCLDMLAVLDPEPDLVTIDMVMPRMDGVTAVERIRADERFAHLPIVMITTQGQQVDFARASHAGVDDYIVKPFDPDDLVNTIDRVIDERR